MANEIILVLAHRSEKLTGTYVSSKNNHIEYKSLKTFLEQYLLQQTFELPYPKLVSCLI